MRLQILNIVLYNAGGKTRTIDFELGKVNIITGASDTGKSALRTIIDYCLGSEECQVPGGVIRDTVVWYGLRLAVGNGQIFVARPDPGPKKTDTRIYFESATQVKIPPFTTLRAVMNVDTLIRKLTAAVGIRENVQPPEDNSTRPPLEATIRHALWFCFLAQGEIANQHHLFHGQGEQFRPQAIKDVLPYFLGVTEGAVIAKRSELRQARAMHRELLRVRALRETAAAAGAVKLATVLAEAQGAGILDTNLSAEEPGTARAALEAACQAAVEGAGGATKFDEQYESLRRERGTLSEEHRMLRTQLAAARLLVEGQDEFIHEGKEQHARLNVLGLFSSPTSAEPVQCPVCEQRISSDVPRVSHLKKSLMQLSTQMEGVQADRPRLERHIVDLEEKISTARRRLATNSASLQAVEEQDRRLSQVQAGQVQRALVIGRIMHFLEDTTPPPTDTSLDAEVAALATRIGELESELSNEALQDRLASVLNLIGAQMTLWAKRLMLEHRKGQYRLDLAHLTVVADTRSGPLPMHRQGGGKSWLGCHLITYLTLQRFFILRKRPVPAFLFLDQPTQISYPPEKDAEGSIDVLTDEDRETVLRIFRLFFHVAEKLTPELQIIIADHADIKEKWFVNAVRRRFRRGVKLIPAGWITTEGGRNE